MSRTTEYSVRLANGTSHLIRTCTLTAPLLSWTRKSTILLSTKRWTRCQCSMNSRPQFVNSNNRILKSRSRWIINLKSNTSISKVAWINTCSKDTSKRSPIWIRTLPSPTYSTNLSWSQKGNDRTIKHSQKSSKVLLTIVLSRCKWQIRSIWCKLAC